MKSHFVRHACLAFLLGLLTWSALPTIGQAGEVLVADRLSNRVYRYSESGTMLGILIDDNVNLDEPNGITVSPDLTKIYVTSRQNSQVVRYDYNHSTRTASNGTVFATMMQGVLVPSSVITSPNGQSVYISNLASFDGVNFNAVGGSTVGIFDASSGTPIGQVTGGAEMGRTALAWVGNDLLVGSFIDSKILKYTNGTGSPTDFITGSGAFPANMIVHGNDLYVAYIGALGGLDALGSIRKYNALTGAIDNTFAINGLAFSASIALNPDGTGLLVGNLGITDGTGLIAKYDFNGNSTGVFANNSNADNNLGFIEASGLAAVPEPSTYALGAIGISCGMLLWWRRRSTLARAQC